MSKFRFLLPAAVLSALCACAAPTARDAAHSRSGPTAKIDDQAVSVLYTRLESAEKRYEVALGLRRDGAGGRATRESGAVLDELQAAAAQCATTPGCEASRFLAAFDHLLRLDSGALNESSGDPDSVVEAEETVIAAGEASPVVANLPEAGRSVALLKGRELGDIIALNGPVKVAIEGWLTQLRPNLMLTYENYSYLRYRMWPEYQKAGLPEALLFGIMAKESGGKVHAVSRSGASGPLQFMYVTGLRFGLSNVNGFDQRFDPTLATRANAAYLNEQLKIFNNNLELVLAAYNGGEGHMQRVAARAALPSFWDAKVYSELSAETREYVPMVLAAAWLFLHPERYNLDFPKLESKSASIVLQVPASLAELTVCLGSEGSRNGWFRTLRNLNPQYEPQQTLAVGTKLEVPELLAPTYDKSCASGQWQSLAADLHSAVAPSVVSRASVAGTRTYVVKRGETLGSIARKLRCVSSSDLAALNRIRAPTYAIREGQTLQLGGCTKN
jgi:membrane-bound lytic murein transglycosylase D